MNVIQKILTDYYEIIEYDLKPRPVVMENIEKVVNCGNPLVRNMTDSDLLDMHYFLTEDDDLDDDEFEKGFYIDFF